MRYFLWEGNAPNDAPNNTPMPVRRPIMQNGGETMAMSDSSFDLILQELLQQKEFMENLETENRELRQQIADLRAGRGISVEILGQRFSLLSEPVNIPAYTISTTASTVPSTPMPVENDGETISLIAQEPASTHEETGVEKQELVVPVPETPLPVMDFLLEDDGPISSSSFLQEMQQTDELSFETTNKLAIWGEPTPAPASVQDAKPQQQPPAAIDEDKKAALRRELIGSFLLE